MDILERIRTLQNERGWTNYQLAQEAAMTQSTLTNMYSRKTLPSITTLLAICDAFKITPSQFFREDETTLILSDEEKFLISKYRLLSKKNKNIVNLLVNELDK